MGIQPANITFISDTGEQGFGGYVSKPFNVIHFMLLDYIKMCVRKVYFHISYLDHLAFLYFKLSCFPLAIHHKSLDPTKTSSALHGIEVVCCKL